MWGGEMNECTMVLGTNALEDLGFCIVNRSGVKIKSDGVQHNITANEQVLEVSQIENSLSRSVGTVATHSDNSSPTQGSTNCGVVKRLTLD